jgi:hypothetical protein
MRSTELDAMTRARRRVGVDLVLPVPALALAAAALATLATLATGCPRRGPEALRCGVTPLEPLVGCPSEGALVAHLRERWKLTSHATITTRCVPGHFGGAGWLIEASASDGGSSASATFVLQPSCGALTDAALRRQPLVADASYETIDLDGDGVDEILMRRRDREAHGTATNLEVIRVGGGRLVRAGKVRLTYEGVDPDLPDGPMVTCTGSVRYLHHPDRGYLLEIVASRTAPSELCLADGVHQFELGVHGLRRRP